MTEAVRALEAAVTEIRLAEQHAQRGYDRWERLGKADSGMADYWLGKLAGLARARQCIQVEIANVLYAESVG